MPLDGHRLELFSELTELPVGFFSRPIICRGDGADGSIILFSDISDVYNVATGHDPHEFIIRKVRQGSTLYFTSPYRDDIVKVRNIQ